MLILYFKMHMYMYMLTFWLYLHLRFYILFLAFSLNCILCAQMRHLILE